MLLRLIGKNLLQRPLRYALTAAAIVFSVAAVCAVFIFTDGLRSTFDELATSIESGYDISVRPTVSFGDDFLAPTVPVEHLDRVLATPGVLAAQPRVVGLGVVPIDSDGEPSLSPAGPNLGVLWGDRTATSRYFAQRGRAPIGGDEFALDVDAFDAGNYEIGSDYVLQLPTVTEEGRTFTLVGTFTFADPDRNALVGARLVAFDEATAVQLINDGRGFSDITVIIEDGADRPTVMAALDEVVDDNIEVRTQEDVLAETQGDFGEILTIFRTVLLVFAIIILFVSSFLIYNVFSITLGQRIRELGLLRAVGAMGSQVTQLMLGEALMLGLIATIVGIPAGMGLAWVLRAALIALGFPDDTGLPLSPWTIVWAVFTGVVVTMLAAVWPSIQARRVSPLSALRDGANITDLHAIRHVPLGIVAAISGLAMLLLGLSLSGWQARFFLPLLGSIVIYVGVLLFNRALAKIVVFPLGVGLLLVALFGDAGLGETFALLGAGATIMLLGANLLNPLLVGTVTNLVGRSPTAVVVGLLGGAMAVAAGGSLIGAAAVATTGVPDSVIDSLGQDVGRPTLVISLLIGAVLLATSAYALLRTALGARGLTGQVARSNASRNPQRTATTAAALMIGLTLVTAVTVIGDSIKSSVSTALSSSITADWLVRAPQSGPQPIPFSSSAADRIEDLAEVDSVVRFRLAFPAAWVTSESGELRAADFQQFLPIVLELLNEDELDPQRLFELRNELGTDVTINDAAAVDFANLDDHVDPDWISRDADLEQLPNAVYLEDQIAADDGLQVGDTFSALFVDLQSEDLIVAGIYENGFVLGNRVMTLDMWERHFPTGSDQFLTVRTASGVLRETAREAITAEIGEDFPILEVQNREEFAAAQERQINQTLATVNVLLGLSAVIAALGILLALALSVFERTREIGLFRAVGTASTQTRWMIRWEGVIVAAFGGLIGVGLGVALGALVTAKMPEVLVTQTSIPIGALVSYLIFSALVGLVAAAFPAWLAGRMNVLEAISSE